MINFEFKILKMKKIRNAKKTTFGIGKSLPPDLSGTGIK